MPDSKAYADLSEYRSAYKLPTLPQCAGGLPDGKTPCFAAVDEEGNPNPTVTDCAGADGETGLDMDMVSATACPDCSILLVQMTDATNGPQDSDFITSVATAASLGAVATSISFGGEEYTGMPDGYTTPGHLVLASSGDTGYLLEAQPGGGSSPGYPASAPDVLGVGGTLLSSSYTETVWNDQRRRDRRRLHRAVFPMPVASRRRTAPPNSAAARNARPSTSRRRQTTPTAVSRRTTATTNGLQVVGTSAATPMVAAILTRLGVAEKVSNDLGFVYTNKAAFNDVTKGTNDGVQGQTLCNSGDIICTGAVGWDGPTGVGTPNGNAARMRCPPPPPPHRPPPRRPPRAAR